MPAPEPVDVDSKAPTDFSDARSGPYVSAAKLALKPTNPTKPKYHPPSLFLPQARGNSVCLARYAAIGDFSCPRTAGPQKKARYCILGFVM